MKNIFSIERISRPALAPRGGTAFSLHPGAMPPANPAALAPRGKRLFCGHRVAVEAGLAQGNALGWLFCGHRVAVEAGLAQGSALGLRCPDLFASRSERRAHGQGPHNCSGRISMRNTSHIVLPRPALSPRACVKRPRKSSSPPSLHSGKLNSPTPEIPYVHLVDPRRLARRIRTEVPL
jgi:hypothetical protein